jgi:hypothetical protein
VTDLDPRPSREEIAARVKAVTETVTSAQATVKGIAADVRAPQPDDVVALFGTHARARMAARRWTLEDLSRRTGDGTGNLAQAMKGTKCPLAIAGRIAAAFGTTLAEMLVPYSCGTCTGKPPAGFLCLECGTEARAA